MFIFDVTHQSLEAGLHGSNLRAQALAQNMANINTAGYRRVDTDFHAQLSQAISQGQASGQANPTLDPRFQVTADQAATAVRADGNTVDVDQEGARVAENALEYQGISQLLGLRRRMLETAMRTSGV